MDEAAESGRGHPLIPRIAVRLAPDIYEGVRRAAKREGVPMSAWLRGAARRRLELQTIEDIGRAGATPPPPATPERMWEEEDA